MKAYVIMETGWEYNDNYNQESGGTPTVAYQDKEKAERTLESMTAEWFKKTIFEDRHDSVWDMLDQYSGDPFDAITPELLKELKDYGVDDDLVSRASFPEKMRLSQEDWNRFEEAQNTLREITSKALSLIADAPGGMEKIVKGFTIRPYTIHEIEFGG